MKILITGANGFVGSHLSKKLLQEGHTVFGLVRTPSKILLPHANFYLIKGDLSTDNLSWAKALPDDLDGCIHTAGLVHSYNRDDFFRVNTEGTKVLILKLKELYPLKFKFLLISSLAAAGPVALGEKKDEEQIDFPVSEYGRSKKESENYLKNLAPTSWQTSIIRPPMIIGPGDMAVLDIFKMVKSRIIILPGMNSKLKEYSFVCVFDLLETITKLLVCEESMLLYSAFPKTIQFKELIEEIRKQLKITWLIYLPIPLFIVKIISLLLSMIFKIKKHDLRLTPDKISELAPMAWTCDSTRSETRLGQIYQYNLNVTVSNTLKDYRERGWI